MTQSILPQHANTLGITFGGQVRGFGIVPLPRRMQPIGVNLGPCKVFDIHICHALWYVDCEIAA
jgi:hypothetical protein